MVVVVPIPVVVWVPVGNWRRWWRFPNPWALSVAIVVVIVVAASTAVVVVVVARVVLMFLKIPKLIIRSFATCRSLTRGFTFGVQAKIA